MRNVYNIMRKANHSWKCDIILILYRTSTAFAGNGLKIFSSTTPIVIKKIIEEDENTS